MTAEEANKIIAEFMGLGIDALSGGVIEFIDPMNGLHRYHSKFTESLDALIPVWRKLKIENISFYFGDMGVRINDKTLTYDEGKTISEAAAIATAKAIQELDK